ncbi:hypothetical protein Hamer_G022794 [Homarus americanus]|uniref:Uncharacterized protein n=1 Tax=Homarus americanus TaxID=6706 RepID=A0A8J5K0X0_HOMAM|nr:hypothetical protein Hamer_G022794 [Homarus americanus]
MGVGLEFSLVPGRDRARRAFLFLSVSLSWEPVILAQGRVLRRSLQAGLVVGGERRAEVCQPPVATRHTGLSCGHCCPRHRSPVPVKCHSFTTSVSEQHAVEGCNNVIHRLVFWSPIAPVGLCCTSRVLLSAIVF